MIYFLVLTRCQATSNGNSWPMCFTITVDHMLATTRERRQHRFCNVSSKKNAQMHRCSCPPRKDFDADPTFGRCLSLKLLRCAAASLCRASEQTNVDKNLRQCLPVQASSSLRQGIAVTHFSSPGNIAHTSSMITGGGNLQKENLREDSSLL